MDIIHKLGQRAVKKKGEGFFLLTDKTGSFLSLGSPQNITHMQGLFHLDKNWKMYKSIENIYLEKEMTALENHFSHVVRKYGDSAETFYLSATALIYEAENYKGIINLDLDFREMFDYDDKGRFYAVEKEEDVLVIHYKKNNKFMAIKGADEYDIPDRWIEKEYYYDGIRGTNSHFYIYNALKIKSGGNIKLFLAFSDNRQEAVDKARSAARNTSLLKEVLQHNLKTICRKDRLAENAAIYSLESLRNMIGKGHNQLEGVFAGLPWFYEFWARDELISLKAFMIEEKYGFVKKRLMNYLDLINTDGRVPQKAPSEGLGSADAIGWLFKRFHDFITILEKRNSLDSFLNEKDLTKIKHKLHFCIEEHMVKYMKDQIIHNDAKETWMDTDVNGIDTRKGACIEIQALFLSFFKLMKLLCKKLGLTYYGYKSLEENFARKVKKEFFKKGTLFDRIGDETARPNIFIAYYVYPELLSRNEWLIAFNKSLRALWCDWGGLTSIDKNNALFQPTYTGQNNLSYHRGDSWYWINNLAAICMHDLDNKKYHYFIDQIYSASEQELLFSGCVGHCAEVSSAQQRRSEGCFSQAWSAAMFVELAEKLKKI